MRTSEEMPMSSMARRSASRIWAALRTRIKLVIGAESTQRTPRTQRISPRNFALCPLCSSGVGAGRRLMYAAQMSAIVNVNGRVSDQEHAVISVFDHGFLYGEGVYETLRTYNGQPFLFDRHMQRLRRSAAMLALPVPLDDAAIDARFRETMQAAGLGNSP